LCFAAEPVLNLVDQIHRLNTHTRLENPE